MAIERAYTNLEIHFHEQALGSVFLEIGESGPFEEQRAELLTYALFTARQMVNCSSAGEPALLFAHQLAAFGRLAANPEKLLGALARLECNLIPYPGNQGRKCFLSKMRIDNRSCQFTSTPKGFGLLATGIIYYAYSASNLLMRYLAEKRSERPVYLGALGLTANGLSEAFALGVLSTSTQLKCAMEITHHAMKTSVQAYAEVLLEDASGTDKH